MPSQHTAPQPIKVRFYDSDSHTEVLRGVGSIIRCERCGKTWRSRSWSELRTALRQHLAEEHRE